jgi:hypothetical protein
MSRIVDRRLLDYLPSGQTFLAAVPGDLIDEDELERLLKLPCNAAKEAPEPEGHAQAAPDARKLKQRGR